MMGQYVFTILGFVGRLLQWGGDGFDIAVEKILLDICVWVA